MDLSCKRGGDMTTTFKCLNLLDKANINPLSRQKKFLGASEKWMFFK